MDIVDVATNSAYLTEKTGIIGTLFLIIVALIFVVLRQDKKIENKDQIVTVLGKLESAFNKYEATLAALIVSGEKTREAYIKESEKTKEMYERLLSAKLDLFARELKDNSKTTNSIDAKLDKVLEHCIKKG